MPNDASDMILGPDEWFENALQNDPDAFAELIGGTDFHERFEFDDPDGPTPNAEDLSNIARAFPKEVWQTFSAGEKRFLQRQFFRRQLDSMGDAPSGPPPSSPPPPPASPVPDATDIQFQMGPIEEAIKWLEGHTGPDYDEADESSGDEPTFEFLDDEPAEEPSDGSMPGLDDDEPESEGEAEEAPPASEPKPSEPDAADVESVGSLPPVPDRPTVTLGDPDGIPNRGPEPPATEGGIFSSDPWDRLVPPPMPDSGDVTARRGGVLSKIPGGWKGAAALIASLVLLIALAAALIGGGASADGWYSVTDPTGDLEATFPDFDPIENPSLAGDINGMFVRVTPGEDGVTVTINFAGPAQRLQSSAGEELEADLLIDRQGPTIINVLFRNDGTSKVSDVTPGISVTSRWSAVDQLVFEMLGFEATPGTEFRFRTIQELNGDLSSDEATVTIEGDGSNVGPGGGGGGGAGGDNDGPVGAATAALNACQQLRMDQLVLELTSPDVQPSIPLAFSASIADAEGFPTPALMWSATPPETTEIVVFVTGIGDDSVEALRADPLLWWNGVPAGGIQWTLSGIAPGATSLARTSLGSPPPSGTIEQPNNVQVVLVDGVEARNKFVGPSGAGQHRMWTVFALCDPEVTGERGDYRAEWLQAHSIAIGWFITTSDW